MRWTSIVLLAAVGLTPPALVAVGVTTARDNPAEDPGREPDRRAIDRLNQDMIRAFEKRDAAGMAAHWTEGGEFIRNHDAPIRGRAEIQTGYAEFFKTVKGKPKVEFRSDAVRFASADMAVTEATLWLRNDDGTAVASARQEAVLVRDGGRWRLAVVREWDRDIGQDATLNDLAWLIGDWQAVAKDRQATLTYAWDENKAFIRGRFTVKDGAKVIESGTQLIGKDNADGVIRWWVFQSDGGFGGGVWARDGKKWGVDAHGVTADGRRLTATAIYVPVDPDTFTWQAVNQSMNGLAVADTPPIKVTKRKPAK